MTKFHINAKGVPAPCKAIKGNCPFGGITGQDNHYDTIEEAQAFIDKQSEQKHGILPKISQYSPSYEEIRNTPGYVIHMKYIYNYDYDYDTRNWAGQESHNMMILNESKTFKTKAGAELARKLGNLESFRREDGEWGAISGKGNISMEVEVKNTKDIGKSYDWDEEHTFNNFDDWVDNFVSPDNSQDNIMKNNFAPWDIEKYKKAKGKSAGVNFDLEKDEDLR